MLESTLNIQETKIHLDQRFNVPPLMPEEDGEAETLVRQITGDNASHKVSYGTWERWSCLHP